MIKPEIRLHLFVAKRGYISEGCLAEVVPYTLYKLETQLQWQITSAFHGTVCKWHTPCNRPR